jgi:nitronate monooxygenase
MARAEVQKLIQGMAIRDAAPMFLVSNPALTSPVAPRASGSFPAHGTRSREQFQAWLDEMQDGTKRPRTPAADRALGGELVVHASNPRYSGDLNWSRNTRCRWC